MNQHHYKFHHEQYTHEASPFATSGYPKATEESKSVRYDSAPQWMYVLDEFLDFLGSVYGFNIKNQVRIGEEVVVDCDEVYFKQGDVI
jgi:hypothetical protein